MKKLSLKILGVIVIAIMLLQTPVVIAASNINSLTNEKKQNDEKINDAKDKKEEIEKEKNQTVKEVEDISSQISEYESQIAKLDSQIGNLNAQISEAETNLNKAQEDYTEQEKMMEKRLIAVQERGETSYLDFLLKSDNIIDLISNYYFVTELVNTDKEMLESIQKQKQEIEEAKTKLETSKKELDTAKASKQGVSTQLKAAKNEKNQQVAKLSEEEKQIQQQIDELAEANKSIDNKIAAARAEAERIRKQQQQQQNNNNSSSKPSGSSTSGTSSSGFIHPVPAAYAIITTKLYYSSGQYHGAVDYGSSGINGQPIYAAADGVVIISERLNGSYGNYIMIEHNNGLFTLYAHGQDGSRTVKVGDIVKQGQQIMRVGSTGNSTGPHLHFEVRNGSGGYNNRLNPLNYLP